MTKKLKIILITTSIVVTIMVGVMVWLGVFLFVTDNFHSMIKKALDVPQLYITCESRYYDKQEYEEETEYKSGLAMYYKKTENGYDLQCGGFSVFDGVFYHDSEGPNLSSGKVDISIKDTISAYKAYFEDCTRQISEGAPMYNYALVCKALSSHRAFFSSMRTSGNRTEYTLFFAEGFYKEIIKYVRPDSLIGFSSPFQYPVIVKFENNRLVQVEIIVVVNIERTVGPFGTQKYVVQSTYEYKINFDYEKTLSASNVQKEYDYTFFQNYEPQQTLQLSTAANSYNNFHKGKLYVIPKKRIDNRHVLEIYDLNSSLLIKKVELPKYAYNVFNMVIHDDCVYVCVDPNEQMKVFCYNEKTEQSTLYDVPAHKIYFVEDQLIVFEKDNIVSCGKDFSSLSQTNKYDDYAWLYYDNFSGNTYAEKEIDGKPYMVKLTKDGFSQNKIELQRKYFRYSFNQDGVNVRQILSQGLDQRITKSKFLCYNSDLEKISEWELENFDGDYLGETADFIFYSTFVIDKKTSEYYGFDKIDARGKYAIFDGVMYSWCDFQVYSTKNFTIINNFE